MAKTNVKKETVSVGVLTCTIEYNSTFTDSQRMEIKKKVILALSEAAASV